MRSVANQRTVFLIEYQKIYARTHYNIASRATQSNSVHVSVLKIPIVHADDSDGVSKSLRFFLRERPLLARGKILHFATIMDTNRDSVHQSQNEDNFPTFFLGLEFLTKAQIEKNNGKGDLASVPSRFVSEGEMQQTLTKRHSGKTKQMTNWSVSTFKGKLKFARFRIVKYKTRAFNRKIEIKPIPILLNISLTAKSDF